MSSIYKRGNRLYISYYLPKDPETHVIATGISWDGPAPTEASLKSRKDPPAVKLKAILKQIELERDELSFKLRFPYLVQEQERETAKSYTFAQLAEKYIEHKAQRRKPLDTSSVALYTRAVAMIEAFHPGASLKDLNKEFVKAFETYIYSTGYELSTLGTYVGKLRTLVNFAVTEEWIGSNPLKKISVSVPEVEPTHDDFEDECEYIRWAWPRKPDFVLHYLYERLTGFRATDGTLLKWSDVDRAKGILRGYNQKIRREETWPIHNTLGMLLDLAKARHPESEYVLPLRNYRAIYGQQEILWDEWEMARQGTHNWKRNYTVDIEEAEPPSHIAKLLKHHKPDDLDRRYSGRPLAIMLKYSNLALDKFAPLLAELTTTVQLHSAKKWRKQRK